MKWVFLVIILVLIAPLALAQTGTIKLLALAENPDGSSAGTLASLSLEVRPGSERVFLETIPLTKVATQISMRFAQQIACKELQKDCSDQDFIYTIVAQPGLVGGPSAGAAAAVLTASMISDLPLRTDTAITGTINSGGLIGPVGGIKEKIEAAGEQGITTVLVPRSTRVFNDSNVTLDLKEWGDMNNVTVIEVATLDEAIFYFTGKDLTRELPDFQVPQGYDERIEGIASSMCKRMQRLQNLTMDDPLDDNLSIALHDEAMNFSRRANSLLEEGSFYSAASYCFRTNVMLNELHTHVADLPKEATQDRIKRIFIAISKLQKETDAKPLNTMTDLQTFMSVEERILETADSLLDASKLLEDDPDEGALLTAYAEERLASAKSWSTFFGMPGRQLTLDTAALQQSCYTKISEAEERFSYVQTVFPSALEDTRTTLDRAHQNALNQSYALCLAQASKAKAEADVILSVAGYEDDQIDGIVLLKQEVARRSLIEAQRQGDFPLIGYNYYQYARDLGKDEPYNSLLFSEYAIELSNLDIYFKKPKSVLNRQLELSIGTLAILVLASAATGASVAFSLRLMKRRTSESAMAEGVIKPSPASLARRRRGKKR